MRNVLPVPGELDTSIAPPLGRTILPADPVFYATQVRLAFEALLGRTG